jgi:hypothetical protein
MLAAHVSPDLRGSLILSILRQLSEDSAALVREAAVLNLAALLPLLPSFDKYREVQAMLLTATVDASEEVAKGALEQVVPALNP